MRGMINGEWRTDVPDTQAKLSSVKEAFDTPAARVAIDPHRLRTRPESYHLYAARACPFAHRTLLARAMTGLEVPVTYADPWLGGPEGWQLHATPFDPVSDAATLWMVYQASNPSYSGRVSVPVLWDRDACAIASADSREIMDAILKTDASCPMPSHSHPQLAALCDRINQDLNLAVYRVGFAKDQSQYDTAHNSLKSALESFDALLGTRSWVWNDRLSAADVMLFATAIRFDAAYHGAFLLLDLLWRDYPGLQRHLDRMLKVPNVAETVDFSDYRVHYFDDAAFSVRQVMQDGRWIIPKTLGTPGIS